MDRWFYKPTCKITVDGFNNQLISGVASLVGAGNNAYLKCVKTSLSLTFHLETAEFKRFQQIETS